MAVTFEQAKKIALQNNPKVNSCLEYDKGYRFSVKDSNADGDAGVVVVKEDGAAVGFSTFIHKYHPSPKYKRVSMGTTVKATKKNPAKK